MSYVVKDYMDKTFSIIDVDASIREAAQLIAEGNQGFLIVTEKGLPKGVIASIDIVSKVVAPGLDTGKVKVKEVMTAPLVTIGPDDDLMKASEIMHKNNLRRLVVEKSGIIYGIITASDIAQRCGEYVQKTVRDIMRWSFLSG
jgi:predicted transcriptional regulator